MKKLLLIIFFSFLIINCLSVTIYLKDNNLLTGEIKKIDKQKIYLSTTYSEKLFIINKTDIKSISGIRSYTESEIDLTEEVLNREPYGRVNYNSYNDVIEIELVDSDKMETINYQTGSSSEAETISSNEMPIFDDKREGYIFSIGIGLSATNFEQKLTYDGDVYISEPESKKGFSTDIRLGYAPRTNIEIYFVNKVSWFRIMNVYDDSVVISNGVGAIGLSYFFSTKLLTSSWVPTLYASIGYGFSGWSTPFVKGASSSIGAGLIAAIGYEFNNHRRLEFSFFRTNPSNEEYGVKLQTDSDAFMLSYNYMWY